MDERKPYLLRINAGLWKEVEAWAQDELRSVNGQIEYLLRQAVNQRRRGASQAIEKSSPKNPVAGALDASLGEHR